MTWTTVGWLALASAASGLSFLAIRNTERSFCDFTSSCAGILLEALPLYLSALGMVGPSLPIALLLWRAGVGPGPLRGGALLAATAAVLTTVLMFVSAYDLMWTTYVGPFELDAVRRPPLPATVINSLNTLGPALLGVWIVLTILQLAAWRLPRMIAGRTPGSSARPSS